MINPFNLKTIEHKDENTKYYKTTVILCLMFID